MFILADIDKDQLFLVRNFDLVVMRKIKKVKIYLKVRICMTRNIVFIVCRIQN